MTDTNDTFDIFLSYNWDSKDVVRDLYDKLTANFGYRVWIDDKQLDSGMLYEQLCQGIKNSKCVICCVSEKYAESDNCIKEITFAQMCKKPLIIVMLERLNVSEIGCVGFIIASLTRFNFYKQKPIEWTGEAFNSMMKSIKANLSQSNNGSTNKFFNAAKFIQAAGQLKKVTSVNDNDKNVVRNAVKMDVSNTSNGSNDEAKKIINFGFGYYEGNVVNEMMEGYGKFYYDNHDKYEGYWHANKKDGRGKFSYYDGETYEGEFVRNQKHGMGKYSFKGGDVYVGQFNDNRINGRGEFYHKNGDKFIGEFKDGKKHGEGEYIFHDGDRITGVWLENKQTGRGVFDHVNGDRYEGGFLNSKYHGYGVFTFASGDKYAGDYFNGLKHGKGTYYFSNGGKYEGYWAYNKKNGFGRLEFTEHEWYEGQFVDGLFDGEGTYHFESGNERSGQWSKGIYKIGSRETSMTDK